MQRIPKPTVHTEVNVPWKEFNGPHDLPLLMGRLAAEDRLVGRDKPRSADEPQPPPRYVSVMNWRTLAFELFTPESKYSFDPVDGPFGLIFFVSDTVRVPDFLTSRQMYLHGLVAELGNPYWLP